MKKSAFILVVLSMFFLGSCFYIRVDYPYEQGRAPMEDYQNNVPFAPGGTLSLENVNGNVEIHGWDQEELAVYAEKTVQLPERTRFYVLPGRDFTPGIIFDKFENFVKIRTKSISGNNEMSFVDYYIDVPNSINLKDIVVKKGNITVTEVYGDAYLDLIEGDIAVENFSGSLTASVDLGSVTASLFDLREEDEVVIISKEGNVTLALPEDTNAHIEVELPEGDLICDFEFDEALDEKKLDIQIGENGPRIYLTALNGDVQINKIIRN